MGDPSWTCNLSWVCLQICSTGVFVHVEASRTSLSYTVNSSVIDLYFSREVCICTLQFILVCRCIYFLFLRGKFFISSQYLGVFMLDNLFVGGKTTRGSHL